MNLFVKILLGFLGFVVLAGVGWWAASKVAAKPGPEAPPLSDLSDAGLQAAVESIAAERKLVGMAARVDVGGIVIAEAVTGLRRDDGSVPLSLDDLFHVGSIGKSMSATTIATLVEDGLMGWDDTLGDSLEGVVEMHPGWTDTTLSQLLTHRAGIPQPPVTAMINSVSEPVRLREVRREVAARILEEAPDTPPGSVFAYSNTGYMLASIMAEETTGESWETLIGTRLAAPMGLETLGFGAPTGGDENADVPWGHVRIGPVKLSMDPADNADNPPWMAAAGTMHIGLDDLLAYGRAHLEAGRGPESVLSAATFDYLHTPALDDYAHGWVVQRRDFGAGSEETVIWHNGSNTMWYAALFLVPERDAVFALLTNDGSGLNGTQPRFDQLAKEIIAALPRPDPG
ncbi:MAG: serine hydrolase domain-containing protein [Litorimonas sp.]